MNVSFYQCVHCGQMIALIRDTGVPIVCCGEPMQRLVAGEQDASKEKHVPVYNVQGNQVMVTVGAISHPMTEQHSIEWVFLQTNHGNQRKELKPNLPPEVCFSLCEGDTVEAVYAYCNQHGLWKG